MADERKEKKKGGEQEGDEWETIMDKVTDRPTDQ